MKRLFAVMICAVAILACTPSSQPVNTAANVNTNDNAPATVAAADLPANLQATEKKFEAKEQYGEFGFKYPSFGVAEIDNAIEKYAKDSFENAKSELAKKYDEDKNNLPPEVLAGYNYTMEYEVVRTAPDGVDILFTHEGYLGGAHGFFYVETKMIDKSGKFLELSDIYADVTAALNRFSNESRRMIPEMIKEMDGGNGDIEELREMVKGGTEPELENFNAILRTDKGLRIYFNPYQVAPWAVGLLAIDVDK